jgi:DNA-binding phage protein
MTFADQLRPLVERAGGPTAAATVCGVTRQTIFRWLRGNEPNISQQTGALVMLRKAKPAKRR